MALCMLALAGVMTSCAPAPYPSYSPHPAYFYDYAYFPGPGVYFNYYSGYYYYRSHNAWVQARALPPDIYLGPRVALRIWSDRPYTYYQVHHKRYRPPASYHPSRSKDRYERSYNHEHHQQYLKRYRR